MTAIPFVKTAYSLLGILRVALWKRYNSDAGMIQKISGNRFGDHDVEDDIQVRQADTPQDRREGKTLPMRHMPKEKPEAGQGPGTVVLSQLPEAKSHVR